MRKQKTLVMGVLASAIVFVGGLVMSPNAEAKEKIGNFSRIELLINNSYEKEITVSAGTKLLTQWEFVGARSGIIKLLKGSAKFEQHSLNDECQLTDGSKQIVKCRKINDVWAEIKGNDTQIQYAIFAKPGTTVPDRILNGQRMTFPHSIIFDTAGEEVKIGLSTVNSDGTSGLTDTRIINVIPAGFFSFEFASFSRQNLWSSTSDEGTSTDNGMSIGYNIAATDNLVIGASLRVGGGFSAIPDHNLFMPGGQNIVTPISVAPTLYASNGAWGVRPSISFLIEPATGTVLNPGFTFGVEAYRKFNLFTKVILYTRMNTGLVENCNSGGLGEIRLNLLGPKSPWDLNLIGGVTIQGKLGNQASVTASPYVGFGTDFRLFGGDVEAAVMADLYTGALFRLGFKTGIPDFWKQ